MVGLGQQSCRLQRSSVHLRHQGSWALISISLSYQALSLFKWRLSLTGFPLRNNRLLIILTVQNAHQFIWRAFWNFSGRRLISLIHFPWSIFSASILRLCALVILQDSLNPLRLVILALMQNLLIEAWWLIFLTFLGLKVQARHRFWNWNISIFLILLWIKFNYLRVLFVRIYRAYKIVTLWATVSGGQRLFLYSFLEKRFWVFFLGLSFFRWEFFLLKFFRWFVIALYHIT